MPLSANLNVSPYFDDYNEDNQYYRVLFKPQVAVQARELNQVQSILQNQIERFGNWAFQNGDIVSGCTIIDIPVLPYIRLQDFQVNGAAFDVTTLVNTQVVSASSNLTARVFIANSGLISNYPNTNVVYVQYVNTGNSGGNSVITFSNNETLNFYSIPSNGTPIVSVNVYATSNSTQVSTGNAHGISVGDGVIFINGVFAKVLSPTFGIVNNFGTYAGNNVIGFQLSANTITENQDTSLNDNALGYSNENAPGAHRLKLIPTLISLDPVTASNTSGFNPIATYNYGGLVSKAVASQNVYSVVGNAIATRIYDEAGNYVVNPFVVDTVTGLTGNSIISSINANTVLGRLGPGVGYAQGQRIEIIKTAYIQMRRGVDTQSYKSQQITFNYGNYFTVNEVAGVFPFTTAQTVNLYDSPQQAVTNRTYASIATPNGNLIGTASLRNFNYISGVDGSNTAIYAVHIFNIKINSGFQVNQIKSIGYTSGTKGFADLTSPGVSGASLKDQLYTFGLPGLKSLRDSSNNNNTQYVYRTNTTSSMYTNGQIVVTLPGSATGGTDILPYGTGVLAVTDTSSITVVATANVDTSALGGTVSISSTNTAVIGSSTSFLTDFNPGSLIKVGSTIRTVASVTNSTYMTIDSFFGSTLSGQTYYKSFLNGRIIPFSYSASGIQTGYVYVSNSTSFQINSTQVPSSTLSVQVYYNILRTNTTPANKTINKSRFVVINTANNVGGPNGPWCLGVSDVHQITAVYGAPSGTFCNTSAITATNITSQFTYDTGQKDTHYDLGYIYPSAGFSATSYPYLLVQMDYFSVNNSPGCGFYTVESYPIDDANTANTNAIQTKDIPLYIDDSGKKNWLRDYVDFRVVGALTANNTGAVSNVAASVSYATINPSSALTFTIPSGGLNVPAYGRNMQADFTVYLPRNDLILITPDNTIKVIEGLSRTNPQPPIFPDNSMAVAVLNIPPYPSLSSDQVDSDQSINKLSKNLIRDTSTAISTNLVTNRRYSMQDIGKLDKRITNLEYYTQLSLLQQKATNMTVTDLNGLNRFKNGIFAESFDSFLLSEVSNPEYSIAIDRKKGQARPKFVTESFKFDFNSAISSNVQKTGRAITLPYTSVAFISQPYATKYRSSAHVASHWSGFVSLMPTYNNNIDQNQTASVGITIDNTTPWNQFANSPFGSIWGAWQTSVNTVSSSVQVGTANVYNVELGYQYTQATSQQALNNAIAQYTAQGYVIGGTSLTFTGAHGGIGSNASITQVS